MAQVTIRANLSNVQIPLITEEFGRSVIVRQQDLNYNPTVASKADTDKDVGIPQVYYAHNVMPTHYGYKTVNYSTQIAGIGIDTFSQVFSLLSATGEKAFLATNTDGTLYVCHVGTSYSWSQISGYNKAIITEGTNTGDGYVVSAYVYEGSAADIYVATFSSATAFSVTKNGSADGSGTAGTEYVSANTQVKFTVNSGSAAFVSGDSFTLTLSAATFTGAVTHVSLSGNTYLCSEGNGLFQYDYSTNKLIWRLAVGLEPTGLLGITSSNGYLLAYSADTVAWSSVIDPLDFVPSLSTGAGSGSVEDAKGPIRRCVGMTSGFLVFTARNCVAAVFGQNIRYPFTFREVPNAGGISDLTLVTDEADSPAVYAFTTHGLQQISTTKSTLVMAEVSDFLTGKRFEDFDSSTLSFNTVSLTTPLKKRIEFVAGRYVIVSYGISSFTHAVIYDTALQRFGKLKYPHTSVFQYGFLDADDADTAKKQIALVDQTGLVKTVEFAAGVQAQDSVLLLGKFQFVRQRMLQLDSVELETVDDVGPFELYAFQTLDGKDFSGFSIGTQNNDLTSRARKYYFRKVAVNHSLLLKGTFRLDSLLLSFNVHGAR